MRNVISFLVGCVLMAGCTPGNGSMYVGNISPIQPGCGTKDDVKGIIDQIRVMDVRADPSAWLQVELLGGATLFSPSAQPPLTLTGGRTIAPGGRERAVVQRVVTSYSSKPAIPGLTARVTDTMPVTATLSSEGASKVYLRVQLFGPTAVEKLRDLAASNDETYQFTTTFEFQGVLAPSGAEWRTAPVSFPSNLIKSDVTCPNGDDRFSIYPNPGLEQCNSVGYENRVTTMFCCNLSTRNEVDLSRPGCDRVR